MGCTTAEKNKYAMSGMKGKQRHQTMEDLNRIIQEQLSKGLPDWWESETLVMERGED